MKIEIPDSLYEQCQKHAQRISLSDDVSKVVQDCIKSELYKHCVEGYDTDTLTGTKIRACLEKEIRRQLFGSSWGDNSIFRTKYLCLDLDKFRKFNETHGITAGDGILAEVGNLLRQNYSDLNIYRVGGDEFAIEL